MPKHIEVSLSEDHLASLTANPRPLASLAEVIWNGLDADAKYVRVLIERNALDGIESIRVQDDGVGISYDAAEARFGNLGDSWKKSVARTPSGRGLHGKSGKGRFRAFGLGKRVTWDTTTANGRGLIRYQIAGASTTIKRFVISDPVELKSPAVTGTEVRIEDLTSEFNIFVHKDTPRRLCQEFAAYLSQYPQVVIDYDGQILDPKSLQIRSEVLACPEVELSNGATAKPQVRVVEWLVPVERSLHLCDDTGVARHELKLGTGVRAPGFQFTAYLLCDAIKALDTESRLELEESDADVRALVQAARQSLKAYFRKRESENLSAMVSKWKAEQIYPYKDEEPPSPIEEAERQVFDIVAINVQEYLPEFENSDTKSRRFTFQLLAQALKDNPESLQEIVQQVLGLKKEDQDDFAELLRRTPLPNVIKASKTVAQRLDFIEGIDGLVHDKETKQALLERDQLHKILEKEAWLISEEFALAGSELPLEAVLNKHLEKLGKRQDDPDPVDLGDGKTGRVDLMFHKAVQPRTGEFDYLVVELKRPRQKIDSDVMTQVKKYARAVSHDERFHGVPARWTFVAISNEMDEQALWEAQQKDKPRGLIVDDGEKHIQVWVKTWSQIFADARARLRFFKEQLNYEATRETSRAYLEKVHAKFLPTPAQAEAQAEAQASPVAPPAIEPAAEAAPVTAEAPVSVSSAEVESTAETTP